MSGRVVQGYFLGAGTRLPGTVQPSGGSGSFPIDPVRVGLVQGGGHPLPQVVRVRMEAAFGADFSAVRVHVGPQAARLGAEAFTIGDDIYFAPSRYQPESMQGRQLLGHELAHVVQQRQGRVRTPGTGVSVVRDDALEAEADRLARRAASHCAPLRSGPTLGFAVTQPGRRAGSPSIQRGVVQRHLEQFKRKSLTGDGEQIWINEQDNLITALSLFSAKALNAYSKVEAKKAAMNIDHLQNGSGIPGIGSLLVYIAAKRSEVAGLATMTVEQPAAEAYEFYQKMGFGPDPAAFNGDKNAVALMHGKKLCPMIAKTVDVVRLAKASYEKSWKMTFDGARGHH
ncbi:MAG: DUF4157 domain-containing protein [Gemmatimonadetes bacterium]|nr:DUF4157 domain-containing protein [Gemmatimonadota bacterium]